MVKGNVVFVFFKEDEINNFVSSQSEQPLFSKKKTINDYNYIFCYFRGFRVHHHLYVIVMTAWMSRGDTV